MSVDNLKDAAKAPSHQLLWSWRHGLCGLELAAWGLPDIIYTICRLFNDPV
jgi:hypothetical protein